MVSVAILLQVDRLRDVHDFVLHRHTALPQHQVYL